VHGHRVFSCFDTNSDADLHALLVQQSKRADSTFQVVDWSRGDPGLAGWEATLRRRIDAVDAIVVICGEFTDSSSSVSRELVAAQEQDKPYVLLWGRRALSCTRPATARPGDLFYTWIWDVITTQVALAVRVGAKVDRRPKKVEIEGGP
jgi:hypothetical protein